MKYISLSDEQTFDIALNFGKTLSGGECVALSGDLGAGKTVFAKGVGKALCVDALITSPTFNIIREYTGRLRFNHIDLYRLTDGAEELGIPELYGSDSVTLIEWAENAPDIIPKDAIRIRISVNENGDREIDIDGAGRWSERGV